MIIFRKKNKIADGKIITKYTVPLYRQKMTIKDGFRSRSEALEYGNNACGAACIKMILAAFRQKDIPCVKELMELGISEGYYREPMGWIHKGLAQLAKNYNFKAKAIKLNNLNKIAEEIASNRLLIASVSCEFDRTRKGGHLIVIYGVEVENGKVAKIYFNDPSSYGQTHHVVDADIFLDSWTGNTVIFWM